MWLALDYSDEAVDLENGGCRMKAEELERFKAFLLDAREHLTGNVARMEDRALRNSRQNAAGDLSNMPIHMADLGTDNFEQEFTLSLMESDAGILGKIEAALERIEDGTYGQCEECGAKIPKTRLNAIPYATMCVKCASQYD